MLCLTFGDKAYAAQRNNNQASTQRVYDYADVLTEQEELQLENWIASLEEKCECDLVVVTINQNVVESDAEWNDSMAKISDDFYDQNAFGYNGALLLDNWYHEGMSDSQAGAWLSTFGKLEYKELKWARLGP